MATYPVRIEDGNAEMWGVFQSTSCTMFSPTFSEEIAAFLFAYQYSPRSSSELLSLDYSDSAQERLALQIAMFLDELCPADRNNDRRLPDAWKLELDPNPYDADSTDAEERAEAAAWKPTYSFGDLTVFCCRPPGNGYEVREADFLARKFSAWKSAKGL